MRGGSWFGWVAVALILAAVALSGCTAACRHPAWIGGCEEAGTAEECARGLLPRPELPWWYQVSEESWEGARRTCGRCIENDGTAAVCSRRLWGTR